MKINRHLLLIILVVGLLWLRSSYGKISGGKFVETLGGTLEKFASQNPYPWFKDFLNNVAIPNSQIFGMLTMWGELFVALTLTLGSFYLLTSKNIHKSGKDFIKLGLIVGIFLNAIFWLASGWMSPSTDGLNLLMFITQGVGLLALTKSSS